jgi:hypothetical protein
MKYVTQFIIVIIIACSCSKTEVVPAKNCMLLSFSTDSPETGMTNAKYEYDTQGRVIKFINNEHKKESTYVYSSSQVIETELFQGNTTKYVYDLNSKGLANAVTVTYSNNKQVQKFTREYDDNGFLKRRTYKGFNANGQLVSQETSNYTFKDGNLIMIESDSGTKATYTYYTDKAIPYQTELPFLGRRVANYMKKAEFVSTTQFIYGYTKIDYINEYDDAGLLTKQKQVRIKTSDGSVQTFTFSNFKFSCQ